MIAPSPSNSVSRPQEEVCALPPSRTGAGAAIDEVNPAGRQRTLSSNRAFAIPRPYRAVGAQARLRRPSAARQLPAWRCRRPTSTTRHYVHTPSESPPQTEARSIEVRSVEPPRHSTHEHSAEGNLTSIRTCPPLHCLQDTSPVVRSRWSGSPLCFNRLSAICRSGRHVVQGVGSLGWNSR